MKKYLLSALLCLAPATANAEGWAVGGSLGPAVIGYSIANRFTAALALGAGLQLSYQRDDGLSTRLSINSANPSFDFYQQLGSKASESGVYLGAGLVYNPFILLFSADLPLLAPLGLKGIVGYELRSTDMPWSVFAEYSPTLYLACLLDNTCREGPVGSLGTLLGLTNLQIGFNYRF
jgi:hypothetical protein